MKKSEQGFSLIEMVIAMGIALVMLAGITSLLTGSLNTRKRETDRTQAISSAQKALNVMSRELANAGFGLDGNGIVAADSNASKVRFRANLNNTNGTTQETNEDVMFLFDAQNRSIVRYDAFTGVSSVLAAGVSQLSISYQDYQVQNNGSVVIQQSNVPSNNTSKIIITIALALDPVMNQPNTTNSLVSEVSLRNSTYILDRY
jgi:prepilin-type N-terminal cleavage/methylation domain-containing protein